MTEEQKQLLESWNIKQPLLREHAKIIDPITKRVFYLAQAKKTYFEKLLQAARQEEREKAAGICSSHDGAGLVQWRKAGKYFSQQILNPQNNE